MSALLTTLILALAVAAGLRGIWSPCGLSMLSTITPIGERGRGHRYGRTAAWYVAGAAAGGLAVGAVLAPVAAVVPRAPLVLALVAAIVALASDARLFGFELPFHRRQVNERWLDHYRPWVYGAGFGWQVGTGFATYIMTAANYLLAVLAVAAGSPGLAVAAWTLFGTTRGLTVLLTRRVRTHEELLQLHRRVERAGPVAARLVLVVESAIAVVAGGSWAPAIGLVTLAIVGLVLGARVVARPTTSAVSG